MIRVFRKMVNGYEERQAPKIFPKCDQSTGVYCFRDPSYDKHTTKTENRPWNSQQISFESTETGSVLSDFP